MTAVGRSELVGSKVPAVSWYEKAMVGSSYDIRFEGLSISSMEASVCGL